VQKIFKVIKLSKASADNKYPDEKKKKKNKIFVKEIEIFYKK
jgi:hypothetical protein